MVAIWTIGFGGLSLAELAAAASISLLFVTEDEGALWQGISQFHHRDAIGLPVSEFFIWGFYVLHTVRFLGGPAARPRRIHWALGLAVPFAPCFSMIRDPALLATAACEVPTLNLLLFHESMDITFPTYMAAMGVLVEYVDVGTGQWAYLRAPDGGVRSRHGHFVMWGGIGLFTRGLLALRQREYL